MQWLKALFVVLRQGEALSDAKTWKDRHQAVNAILALLAVAAPICAHYGIALSPDDAGNIAAGIAALGGIVTAYLVPATSDKTGLPAISKSADDPHSDTDNLMG